MIDQEMVEQLIALSTLTEATHRAAKRKGRTDLLPDLRRIGLMVASVLAGAAREVES